MTQTEQYLLTGVPLEVERLRLQARVWEPAAEEMLDQIGFQRGWRCVDVGCGPMGILGPLSRRTGPGGRVFGFDNEELHLEAARNYVVRQKLRNVEILNRDLFVPDFPREWFDFAHGRFVLAPIGRAPEVLGCFLKLVRPGGVIALQEPDPATWICDPPSSAWESLKAAVIDAFAARGGDFGAGTRITSLLRRHGLRGVQQREVILNFPGSHPYSHILLHFARALRPVILSRGLVNDTGLEDSIQQCEENLDDAASMTQSFRVTQAWGSKPEGAVAKRQNTVGRTAPMR